MSRSIVAFHLNYLANAIGPLARVLRADHDIDMTLVCFRRDALPNPDTYDFRHDDFAEIVEIDPLFVPDPDVSRGDMGRLADEAGAMERRIGMTVTELIRTDRMLGMGYVNGARFPESRYGWAVSHTQTVAIALRLWRFYEELLDLLNPVAVLNRGSALGPATLWYLARARGVEVRTLAMGRSGSREGVFWTGDTAMRPIGLEAAYAGALSAGLTSPRIALPADNRTIPNPYRAELALSGFAERASARNLVRKAYKLLRRRAGDVLYRRQRVYGGYVLSHELRLVLNRWWWNRAALRTAPVVAALPDDTPIVYYPLQIEPESTLMLESQMCDNQLTAIDWLAKTLPGGWLLVVKEHPGATAPRPAGFWTQVSGYPNVVVASVMEDSAAIVERARAVAALNGTVGLQAAVSGKPVISFHPFFIAAALDHGLVVRSYEETRTALTRIRDGDLPPVEERLRQGRALHQALRQCEFSIGSEQILRGVASREAIDPADISVLAEAFLESIGGYSLPVERAARQTRPSSAIRAARPHFTD